MGSCSGVMHGMLRRHAMTDVDDHRAIRRRKGRVNFPPNGFTNSTPFPTGHPSRKTHDGTVLRVDVTNGVGDRDPRHDVPGTRFRARCSGHEVPGRTSQVPAQRSEGPAPVVPGPHVRAEAVPPECLAACVPPNAAPTRMAGSDIPPESGATDAARVPDPAVPPKGWNPWTSPFPRTAGGPSSACSPEQPDDSILHHENAGQPVFGGCLRFHPAIVKVNGNLVPDRKSVV